jgi:hypothetical protein
MNTEITNARANMINDSHQELLQAVETTKHNVVKAMQLAVAIGNEIAEIPRGTRIRWMHDNCPNITKDQIASYLGIANTVKKRKHDAIDHRALNLLGIIETIQTESQEHTQDERNKSFVIWVSKTKAFLNELSKRRPIDQWTRAEKDCVAWQIKPLAEMYQQLIK